MSKEVKIGIILILALASGIWGFNYLKGINLFGSPTGYYSIYENTGGLAVSSFVVYSGNKVGRVNSITLEVDSNNLTAAKWRVDFSVDNPDLFVPKNTIAKIGSSDLLGSKAIQLILGDSEEEAEVGKPLDGELQTDITAAVRAELEPLKKKTEELVGEVDLFLGSVRAIFEDDATQSLPQAFKSLENSLKTLETTSLRIDGMVAENREKFGSVMSNIKDLTYTFKMNSGAIDTIITNFSSISDSLAQVQFATVINKVQNTMTSVADITDKINNGDGTMAQLINSDSLIVEIQRSNKELQYLLNDIYSHPKKYLSFSVIERKDKDGFSKKEEERIKELINQEK